MVAALVECSTAHPRCLLILLHLTQGLGSPAFGGKALGAGLSLLPDMGRRRFFWKSSHSEG